MNAIDIKNYVENRIKENPNLTVQHFYKLDSEFIHYDVLLQCDRTFERYGDHGHGFAETDNVDSIDEAFKGLLDHLCYYAYENKRELQSTIKRQVKRERTYGMDGEFKNYGPTQTARWANRLRYLLMQS